MKHLVLICLVLSLVAPLGAAVKAGVTMSDTLDKDGVKFVLNGMALRKKVFFQVYVAGLYLPQKEKDAAKIFANDAPRLLVMRFVRTVDAGKISEAWKEGLEANTPNASPAVKKQFDTMNSWMEELKEGENLEFEYLPGKGTTITVKGKVKGSLEGKPFADAMFACWIGPKPGPGEDFKKGLLGF